jgi:hypothetical protein
VVLVAPTRRKHSLCFTDGFYVPLGGQHISAAVKAYYEEEGGERCDATIEPQLKMVRAEVLKPATPIEVCKLAAGQHQNVQGTFHSMTVADIFAFLVQTSKEKKQKYGTSILSEKDVQHVGFQLGLQKFFDRHGNRLPVKKQV